ncbi:MAG TPA: response regulator [Bacteroidales bacterium]
MYQELLDQSTILEEPESFCAKSKKILFVDNDIASYYLANELLKEYEIEVIHAECGFSAIRLFVENTFVDAVITELKVPRLDGFGLLKEFKSLNSNVPVIVQTACEYTGMKQTCLDAGFDGYIPKPLDFGIFIEIVHKHIIQIKE